MKKLTVICIWGVVMGLMGGPVFAIEYCKDFLETGNPGGWSASHKTFEDEWTMDVSETVDVDIWINECPEAMLTGGVFITYDHTKVTVVEVMIYDGDNGPWDDAMSTELQVDPDNYLIIVGNFACVNPDAGGDIIIAKIRFHCEAGDPNTAITVSTVPEFDNFVGCSQPPVIYDPDIFPNIITICQIECEGDEECNDDNFCTVDSCDLGTNQCVFDPLPNGTSCDDGLYCNGADTCEEGVCEAGIPPCPDDSNPCNDCNEDTDICCSAIDTSDPCCGDPACAGEEVCLIEFNDFYVNGTDGDNGNDGLDPLTAWKTITHALSQVPTIVTLDENNRAIVHVAESTYDTVMEGGDAETFPLFMKKYVSLVGDDGYDGTIINADLTDNVIEFTKEEDSANTITIEGFTITGGYNFRGGGITVLWADPKISSCFIYGNTANDINGGGIYLQRSNATIINCIIANNSALQQKGGGISCGNESNPDIISCTIVDNGAGCGTDEGGGGISIGHNSSAIVIDSILWGNYRDCLPDPEPNQILTQEGASFEITYSCIQGGYIGDGNTDQDPVFFDATYNLMYGSSCIDSSSSVDTPTSDINVNDRWDGCAIPNTGVIEPLDYYDMGAIEYQGDSDLDGILDDGDESCEVGDNPCLNGTTEDCDDNCTYTPNPDQADIGDEDGAGDVCDNCVDYPNSTLLGTCAKQHNPNMVIIVWDTCTGDGDCGTVEFCEMNQLDSNGNGIGDVCECEGDFDCDLDVDGTDAIVFKEDFGRNQFNNPCTVENPCVADFDGDGDVDGSDAVKFKEDFGRSYLFRPCPPCP